MGILRKLHNAIRGWFVRRYRTNEIVRVFSEAHAVELKEAPVQSWPLIRARQEQELALIRAGKLDIVDRKSWAWPFLPASVTRLSTPIMKSSPYNLRRMSRTPVPRRAINLIKGAVISQPWDVRPLEDSAAKDEDEQKARIAIAKKILGHPNNQDSFQTWMEMSIEDMLIFGAMASELCYTPDVERPLKLWAVNVESVRIFASWAESTPDMPRYAQMTGLKGERGAVLFYDDEMLYLKDNPSTDNPFGLGKMEVAFSCYDEGTEVLTKRGWLPWRSVVPGEVFATRAKGGRFEWQKASKVYKHRYSGKMVQFKNQSVDLLVTPNHRMYGWSRAALTFSVNAGTPSRFKRGATAQEAQDAGMIGFMVAGDVAGLKSLYRGSPDDGHDFRVPRTSVWIGHLPVGCENGRLTVRVPDGVAGHSSAGRLACNKVYELDLLDWVRFLGLYVAEGSCTGSSSALRNASGQLKGYSVNITQMPTSRHYTEIGVLLDRLPWRFARYNGGRTFNALDKALYFAVKPLGNKYQKYVPDWIKELPVEYIREFVDWAIKGDGHVRPNGMRTYITSSPRLADDMQELFQKLGSSVATTITYPAVIDKIAAAAIPFDAVRERFRQKVPMYMLHERIGVDYESLGDGSFVDYDGFVYCASVPNRTLYVRRNGQPLWCGNSVNDFLGVQHMAGRAGTDQVHKTWLWWEQPQADSAYQIVRRHIQNELEGQAKVSLIGGMKKPDVLEITPVTEADLLLNWQEMLIRMIANAFDMSALALGIEHDVNRATGQVLDDKDHRSTVVPMAKRIQEGLTRKVLHEKLGWYDLEFAFLNLEDPNIETKMDMYSRMYSMNATTPNLVCVGLGKPKLRTPLADLTQIEAMLMMTEAQIKMQAKSAEKAQQSQPPPMMPPDGSNQGEEPSQETPATQPGLPGVPKPGLYAPSGGAGPGKGVGLTAPKKIALPKFPISGSRYTARQIAQMPVNQLSDLWMNGELPPPSKLLRDMEHQEPGILEEMTEELREFLDQALEEEKKAKAKKKLSGRVVREWEQEQSARFRKQGNRSSDFVDWLKRRGTQVGKPGGGARSPGQVADQKRARRAGRPGGEKNMQERGQ